MVRSGRNRKHSGLGEKKEARIDPYHSLSNDRTRLFGGWGVVGKSKRSVVILCLKTIWDKNA